MGCGTSTGFIVTEEQTRHIEEEDSPPPLQTRILQDDVLDTYVDVPEPVELKKDPLPEGVFIDGMLGILNESLVSELLSQLSDGELFEDPDFPADCTSLRYTKQDDSDLQDITWARPYELSEDPRIFIDGVSRSDVKQGILGDCWFLSACASIASSTALMEKVIPPGQVLSGDYYKGLICIHFWRFGKWVTVHIDDRLPVKNGNLLYASCADPNEFWVSFVEKAYAKLHGSYEALAGGHALEAFVDLTGGLAERVEVTPELFRKLRAAFSHGAFITCARKGTDHTIDSNGLVRGHAYTVTDVRRIEVDGRGSIQMIRVRNPWADDNEWTGAWCDRDERWNLVDDSIKQELGVTNIADGEFWMEFADFQTEFQEVTIASLGPDFDFDGVTDVPGQELCYEISIHTDYTVLCVEVFHKGHDKSILNSPNGFQVKITQGCWVENQNAGGCRNDLEKFATNPQYLLTLAEPDDPDPDSEEILAPKCTLIIGLMQEHRRSEKNKELRMLSIAFFIYKTDTANERLDAEYFLCVPEEASSGVFINSREVIGRFELEPGKYVIIPATFYHGRSRNFMLRVFALKPFSLKELPPFHNLSTDKDIETIELINNNIE